MQLYEYTPLSILNYVFIFIAVGNPSNSFTIKVRAPKQESQNHFFIERYNFTHNTIFAWLLLTNIQSLSAVYT